MDGQCFHNEEDREKEDASTLLQIQKLEVADVRRKCIRKETVCMWDPGSTLSLITFNLAMELGIQGEPIELEICTVGGALTKISSKKYSIAILDSNGQDVRIEVLGI